MTKCKECGSTYHVDGKPRKHNICPLCGCNNDIDLLKHWTENYPKLLRNSLDNLPANKKPEKFNWDNYKNRVLDVSSFTKPLSEKEITMLKNSKMNNYIREITEELTGWFLKLKILSAGKIEWKDITSYHDSKTRNVVYKVTIPPEMIKDALDLYSQHENRDIMLSEYFRIYNELVEKK